MALAVRLSNSPAASARRSATQLGVIMGGVEVRALTAIIILSCCLIPAGAWAGDSHVALGFGGGLDISSYSDEGLFDFGPVLGGFVAWTGSYPRVYRLTVQWTQLYHERQFHCFQPAAVLGSSSCDDDTEIINLTSVQIGAIWFETEQGWASRYGGGSIGMVRMGFEDDPAQSSLVLSVIFGVRFRGGGWAVSVESGGELVAGESTSHAVIPVRLFLEI